MGFCVLSLLLLIVRSYLQGILRSMAPEFEVSHLDNSSLH